jgi:phosphatidate phosphatase APP1
MTATTTPHPSQRPHFASKIEGRIEGAIGSVLRRYAGWTPRIEPFTGYGTPERVRVIARVLLGPPEPGRRSRAVDRRGFRHFFTLPAPGTRVPVMVGGVTVTVEADHGGYIDAEVDLPPDALLQPGWQQATIGDVRAPLLVIDESSTFGVVSDIDDTTMVTAVPRLLLAAWNTFVRQASARRAVPGMPELYRQLATAHPDAPFVYVSTGAWNTARVLRGFLTRNGYPAGPLLLTDWGPTQTGWFRSGQEHKDTSIDRLMTTFPHVRWLLVGDDGQHDPDIYRRATERWPDRVVAVAIRQLTPAQQVLAHGTPVPNEEAGSASAPGVDVPTVQGGDGGELAKRLADVPGVLVGN